MISVPEFVAASSMPRLVHESAHQLVAARARRRRRSAMRGGLRGLRRGLCCAHVTLLGAVIFRSKLDVNVRIKIATVAGDSEGFATVLKRPYERSARGQKSDEQWREELTPAQYDVLRRAGTEPPFTGEYVYNKDDRRLPLRGCGATLFGADTKFESGTGWPSFTEPAVADAVELRPDNSLFMRRTEVLCRALRRPPRARLRRRSRADRRALLHQLGRARRSRRPRPTSAVAPAGATQLRAARRRAAARRRSIGSRA